MTVIPINKVKKEYLTGTHRAVEPQKTLERIRPLMNEIGVAEITDLTDIDRLGIPIYSAIRPGAKWGGTRIHMGKGILPVLAEVSAMMGAIERFSAEYRGERMEFAGYEQMGLTKALDPRELILPQEPEIGEEIHWLPAWDILNEFELYIPANAVFHPYDPLGNARHLFRSDTNGLAAGNVMEEAILHGIYEVIERDSLSNAEKIHTLGRRLIIDREGPLLDLVRTFENAGIKIHLWYLHGKTGIHTVAAAADDTVAKDPAFLLMGSGTHLNPGIAAFRALTEVAQSRGSTIKGYRENDNRRMILEKAGYERLKRINRMWFEEAEDEINLSDIPDKSTDYIDEDIRVILKELKGHTDHVFVYDLSKTEIPVVRVVIPGFEVSYVDSSRKKTSGQKTF
ncbi:MAG: YcaO-related McrA-glycine thioamidation protein [Methanomicrobiaceae archaeon]|nr:YcaO-related McrA-glycine thioamidation protein [Methanomicrobiaceae archaeon]